MGDHDVACMAGWGGFFRGGGGWGLAGLVVAVVHALYWIGRGVLWPVISGDCGITA